MPPYKPYIPNTLGELRDFLGSMVLDSPDFSDDSGFFHDKNIETEYFELAEGLKLLRPKLGDDNYAKLIEMADQTKAYFLAATHDEADEVWAGRHLLLKMVEIVGEARPVR